MSASAISIRVQAEKEVREIAQDFRRPVEVLREALANAYDANATEVRIPTLDLELSDDGEGMDVAGLEAFFGLGIIKKSSARPPIGHKGHGTKVYYLAREIWLATRTAGGELLVAHVPDARARLHQTQLPEPRLWRGEDAERVARERGVTWAGHGTRIKLLDFTTNSGRLVDVFRRAQVESYLRWFTLFGSFGHVIAPASAQAPLTLMLDATDDAAPKPVTFGHAWPTPDLVDHKVLKAKDERRPFNDFRKTFTRAGWPISGGHTIDIAVLFEGKRGRLDRDRNIRRQGTPDGLYTEEERYGLWLCRDYIPIELRSEWLQDERLDVFDDLEPKRALVLVNCQALRLTANRGSVGNSDGDLLRAVRDGVVEYIQREIGDDKTSRAFARSTARNATSVTATRTPRPSHGASSGSTAPSYAASCCPRARSSFSSRPARSRSTDGSRSSRCSTRSYSTSVSSTTTITTASTCSFIEARTQGTCSRGRGSRTSNSSSSSSPRSTTRSRTSTRSSAGGPASAKGAWSRT